MINFVWENQGNIQIRKQNICDKSLVHYNEYWIVYYYIILNYLISWNIIFES